MRKQPAGGLNTRRTGKDMMDSTGMTVILPLLIGEASGVFASFNPSWFTVSSPFFHSQEARDGNIKRIRWGETAATAIVVATGLAISRYTKSNFALIASVLISAVFVAGYEYMIAHPSTEGLQSWRRAVLFPSGPELQARRHSLRDIIPARTWRISGQRKEVIPVRRSLLRRLPRPSPAVTRVQYRLPEITGCGRSTHPGGRWPALTRRPTHGQPFTSPMTGQTGHPGRRMSRERMPGGAR